MTGLPHPRHHGGVRAVHNPPNPFDTHHRELLEPAPDARVEIFEDSSRRILSRNESPDLPFRWSVNPYRGCFHACAYCYARPTHEYWGFGAGTDFDSKLVVKPDAPSLLRQAFLQKTWRGELVVFSGNTDCYQPMEATYGLTRACLEVCAEFRNPVAIITKGALILRDLELLQTLHREAWLRVYFSIPFANPDTARKLEPHVPSPEKRLEAIRRLSEAGLITGVSLAPIVPGLNDHDIPRILRRARDAGAVSAFMTLLRLPGNAAAIFWERLADAFPHRVQRVRHRLQQARQGAVNDGRFFDRQVGQDEAWRALERLFDVTCRTLGLSIGESTSVPNTFRRPEGPQTRLF